MNKKYYYNFEFSYEKTSNHSYSSSLYHLFNVSKEYWPNSSPSILETGCGTGALSGEIGKKCKKITGCDISKKALKEASTRYPNIKFLEHDICQNPLDRSFDIIIDGHLLHCLTCIKDRDHYLQNIIANLNDKGVLILESLVQSKKMSFTPPYYYKEPVLYQKARAYHFEKQIIDDIEVIPTRYIPNFLEIEELILSKKLEIKRLAVPFGLKGQISEDNILEKSPDIIQIIAVKR